MSIILSLFFVCYLLCSSLAIDYPIALDRFVCWHKNTGLLGVDLLHESWIVPGRRWRTMHVHYGVQAPSVLFICTEDLYLYYAYYIEYNIKKAVWFPTDDEYFYWSDVPEVCRSKDIPLQQIRHFLSDICFATLSDWNLWNVHTIKHSYDGCMKSFGVWSFPLTWASDILVPICVTTGANYLVLIIYCNTWIIIYLPLAGPQEW